MNLEIRPATSTDIPLILEFVQGLAKYEKLEHEVEATPAKLQRTLFPTEETGKHPIQNGNARCILAFADGAPAGFALYFFNYSTFLAKPGLYLEDLFVQPDFRGKGIGKSLLLHLAKLANTLECGRMEWSVLDWNEPAKGFYRNLGAVQLDDWRIFRLTGPALARYK